jgi:predicted short-subunit dehydrogenase-like oxidoreductase (DUF2520 family)
VRRKPAIAIVGAGSLATSLALALDDAGYRISEIISRDSPSSRRRVRQLADLVGARVISMSSRDIAAPLVWFCVPDRAIRAVGSALAGKGKGSVRFAFHSSGALPSAELDSLRQKGVAVAAVHPLMTFVPGSRPPLAEVPFALEGDPAAIRLARQIVRALGGESFLLPASRKPAYHAWATFTSPLLLAFLVTLEDAARAAGLKPSDARRRSLPIIQQTLANYARLGPAHSFSGPIIRGDVETVARHLKVLKKIPEAREVYVALARSALRKLPSKNGGGLSRLLKREFGRS